ncbi:hypothetical protein N7337_04350 [Comamonas aquatica]|uniref:hypothetical protein n=1 Tax=Comamonas aquatica TaxID=225991 RepID=UPI00244B4144|nr:hypothetical protein [Comamonas aquatica]MDH0200153.1 hypothetical protein [Comamonas aquatica]
MDTIIVYVDDAEYAKPLLQTMAQAPGADRRHCVLVACAPRITHRVSRFVSNRARENWRNKWADKLFEACAPALAQSGGLQVSTMLARGPLPDVLAQLQAEHGTAAQVVDLRRPKLEVAAPKAEAPMLRKLAGTLAGIGALWSVLIGETLAA